ncbi:MAG: UDP-3-O-acyl-N-acetylglucosamine deacetylase [Alphaproteobacteria bacterium]|nr:UDP-3-O-acyl-N-acetylglucosamine deacetylase [Alphaproteobacteria bacterium]
MQSTIKSPLTLSGIGLHTGKPVRMTLHSAPVDHGVVFVRTDIGGSAGVIPATWDKVTDTRLCTVISNDQGVSVGTIEHLMAALRGCGVDNVRVEIDAPEVPILDGSAQPFVVAIEDTGRDIQTAPRRAIRVLKDIIVTDGDKEVRLSPSVIPSYTSEIHYAHPDIGIQRSSVALFNGNFKHDIADCRTFGFMKEVETLRAMGLAQGGSLENAVVLDDNGILNPEGLRCADEFARHKVLDAIGDLYLAGGVLMAAYTGIKGGHALNNAVLRALFADPSAWDRVDLFVDLDPSDTRMYAANVRPSSVSAV